MVRFPLLLDIFVRNESGQLKAVERVALTQPATYSIGRLPDKDIVLDAQEVSRNHALLVVDPSGLEVVDDNSRFGTFIGEKQVFGRERWTGTTHVRIGSYEIAVVDQQLESSPPPAPAPSGGGLVVGRSEPAPKPVFPYSVFNAPVVDVGALRTSGLIQGEYEYLALGGGLGSFTWVDHLRIFGVPAKSICVLGSYAWNPEDPADHPRPYGNYRRLCLNSQIPGYERLRSNSISAPDNIWGFPGYASRETWRDLKRLRFGGGRHILRVFGEPALAQSYTPRSDDVFNSIDTEAARIGWKGLCLNGRVLAMRETSDGRYAVAVRLDERQARVLGCERNRIVVGKYVQLSTGYPAYRTEQDVYQFNTQHLNLHRVFKAYDNHELIYQELERSRAPAVIVVRGRGIVASRILQRINLLRTQNDKIQVYHQMRSAVAAGKGRRHGWARRRVFNNTELQPFNWPKACWGGELRAELENAPAEVRSKILDEIGGTTTAARNDWTRIVKEGKRQGWYRVAVGRLEIKGLSDQGTTGKILMEYSGADSSLPREIRADYVIDCIGLIGDVTNSELLKDLVETYKLPRNRDYKQKEEKIAYRGLAVTPDFEVAQLRQSSGARVYAAGQITVHGPYAAVDSFLGLQYAALRSVDHLYSVGAPHIARFGFAKSFGQWLRWCFNRAP
jgi:pSer/pThr/pTyr-binding forkhead associated (FHA) protein